MSQAARSTSIKTRLLWVIAAALAGMAIVSGFALLEERDSLTEDRKIKTRHLVETGHGILVHHHALQ